jgi:hypothetical protein
MECGHIIVPVPAGECAGICLDRITAPAVIDAMLAQVISAVLHTTFAEVLFSNVSHVTGIAGPVSAAIDQQDIKWPAIMGELGMVRVLNKFMGRAVAYGTSPWRFFTRKDKTTDGASPGYFRFCGILSFLT